MTDPFAAPAVIPSNFPTVASLRGRLVLIKPVSQKTVPNNLGKPGDMQEQITANVTVVDGLGPVPQMKNGNQVVIGGQPQWIDGPEWNGMWISSEVIVKQLADALSTGGMVLGRVNTPNPNAAPGKGNAWGLVDPTEEDKQTARSFLASRMVGAAAAPAAQPVTQSAPVYVQQTPAQAQILAQGVSAQSQFPAVQQNSPSVNAGPAPTPGTNPFA